MITLGSLFDGSGGFPLAGVINGITPVWSSEIEPYPLRVTAARFPNVKQLGSVLGINGAEIEPVDIITFGSPCQDLSVAGKQLGIHDGERSNLFFEAIRIIKEMRDATRASEHIRPRFAVWENVPGAFSSNKGDDFRAVLQAFASVCTDGLDIPGPPRGKWSHAGGVAGDGWSVAWRVYDAQYWGVPQRRKRIYLIADFGSERAHEILFKRESVSGHPSESGSTREGTAADAERSIGGSCLFEPRSLMEENWAAQDVKNALRANASKSGHCVVFKERAGKPGGGKGILPAVDRAFTLATNVDQSVCYPKDGVKCLNPWDCQSKRQHDIGGEYPTLQAYNGGGGRCDGICYCLEGNTVDRNSNKNGKGWCESVSPTLNTQDKHAVCYPETARTLAARHDSSPCVDRGQNVIVYKQTEFAGYDAGCGTLRASGGDAGGYGKHHR